MGIIDSFAIAADKAETVSKYILRRLIQTLPVVFIMSVIVFGLTFLIPGDPVVAILGPDTARTLESLEIARKELGLDQPLPMQYVNWLGKALQGDLGRSTRNKHPVSESLAQRLPVSIELAVVSIIIAAIIAVPLGILAAIRVNSHWDLTASLISVVGLAIPNFWLGILMIWLFAVQLKWLPASGYTSVFEDPVAGLRSMIMPALALGGGASAGLMRHVRSSLLEVLRDDYVRTARAKGLPERRVLLRHALKNSLIPVVTVMGLTLGGLMGGSLIVESIFLVPGVGSLLVTAIFHRDFPVIQAGAMVLALFVIAINLGVDLLYAFLDPRIRYE